MLRKTCLHESTKQSGKHGGGRSRALLLRDWSMNIPVQLVDGSLFSETDPNRVMHHATHSAFASPTVLCVVKMSFQQESYKRKAFWLGGERRRKNSIPLSSMHLTDKQLLQRGSVKISSCA